MVLRSGPANSETAEMGVLTYLGWLVLAGVETRWNVMGGCPPSRMQKLYLASCGRHDELGMCSLNLLTKVTDLTLESLPPKWYIPEKVVCIPLLITLG